MDLGPGGTVRGRPAILSKPCFSTANRLRGFAHGRDHFGAIFAGRRIAAAEQLREAHIGAQHIIWVNFPHIPSSLSAPALILPPPKSM
jgi:hypothetical protein